MDIAYVHCEHAALVAQGLMSWQKKETCLQPTVCYRKVSSSDGLLSLHSRRSRTNKVKAADRSE